MGKATVTITFDAWPEGQVAGSHQEVEVVAAKTSPKLEPVSSRLKRSLIHSSREGTLVGLRYSPDGQRLIAGDYPGGVIQVWDAETGKQLIKIETGHAYRSSSDYFFLSPDWNSVYVCRMKREVTRIEQDDKKLYRYDFDGDVRAWDLATGDLRDTLKHDPPRGIEAMTLSPDGTSFVTFEEAPGEAAAGPQRSTSLWSAKTKELRPLPGNIEAWAVYSPDGRMLAAPVETESGRGTAIKLFDLLMAQEKVSIPIAEKDIWIGYIAFSPDGRLLAGQVRTRKREEHWLKFWDPATGQEVASFTGENKDIFFYMAFSPDRRTLAVTNLRGDQGKLFLFDLPSKKLVKTVNLGENAVAGEPAFSPDGNWIALSTQVFPDWPPPRDPDPMDFPQPRILVVDVAAGEVRETLVAPQGFGSSACFSPDGQTLATGGSGKVLLWDLTTPPRVLRPTIHE